MHTLAAPQIRRSQVRVWADGTKGDKGSKSVTSLPKMLKEFQSQNKHHSELAK